MLKQRDVGDSNELIRKDEIRKKSQDIINRNVFLIIQPEALYQADFPGFSFPSSLQYYTRIFL